jgi:hypothetical protein
LKDDFNLPGAPADPIRHAAGISDGVIEQIGRSILSDLAAETPLAACTRKQQL